MTDPQVVIDALNEAGVHFVVMGTHGVGSWRSQPRATEDIDVLITKRDHAKAVRTIEGIFPELVKVDGVVVTRFLHPETKKPRVDLMKPVQDVFKMVFRHTISVDDAYRIPDLEMALVSKFAAIVSPNRNLSKKHIDIGDFADIVQEHEASLDLEKLKRLATKVYSNGGAEILRLVADISAGRDIVI